jgi:RNA polymerase subunit RPABC4/transcription elongation factor Spt4
MENETQETEEKPKAKKNESKMEKIQLDKLRGRVIIFNPEESEFAKNLNLIKKADYTQKIK